MRAALVALVVALVSVLRSRASLHLDILALRHQLAVLQDGGRRPRLKPADRLLWVWLSRGWSGWQDALVFVERIIGSIRRECLDNLMVLSERHLRRTLKDYFAHYHRWRCHQSLEMDCPEPRPVQPPEVGEVVEVVEAGGLYRHYERLAA